MTTDPVTTCKCGAPASVISIDYTRIEAYRTARLRHDDQRGTTVEEYSAWFLTQGPRKAAWRVSCADHVPGDGYEMTCPRTWREWVHHTAHLLESKDWLPDTNWDDLLHHALYPVTDEKTGATT